jgi:hypothetical protein
MANLITNINQVCADLTNIKNAIQDKGVDIVSGTPSSEYASKINEVYESGVSYADDTLTETNDSLESVLYGTGEGSKSWYDKYMEVLELHPEKTVSRSYISVDDVSELPHNVKCKVTGVENPESVRVTRRGKNIVDILNGAIQYTTVTIQEKTENTLVLSCTGEYKAVCYILPNSLEGKYITASGEWDNANGAKGGLRINWIKKNNVADMTSTHITTTTSGVSAHGLVNPPPEDAIGLGLIVYGNANGSIEGEGVVSYRNIQLEVSNVATEYEPYNAQTLTPNADGTVEGMTSISPHMSIYTNNADAMLDVTYRQSAGIKAEYDRFWDEFQQNGNRTDYRQAFAGYVWKVGIFKPKHDMHVTNAYMMFMNSQMEIDLPDALGVVLDFANCVYTTSFQYTFNSTWFTRIGEVDGRKAGQFFDTFSYSSRLRTIDKIICNENTTFTNNCFLNCTVLANIIFEGIIGNTINFQWCPLTKASITNIVEHLSSTATGQTCTFKKTAKEAAFTDEEWNALISTKSNWTFSLI